MDILIISSMAAGATSAFVTAVFPEHRILSGTWTGASKYSMN